jgi:hypothetical protein
MQGMAKYTLNLNGPSLKLSSGIKAASFDYVGRYQLIAEIVSRYFTATNAKPKKILDVGGLGSLLGQMLSTPITILDNEAPAEQGPSAKEKRGDGADMNSIKDNAYDVVVTSDTLEHIPPEDRKSFINELIRVSDDLVVLCAPFNHGQPIAKEEDKLQHFYKNAVGEEDRWLQEHKDHGLPKEKEILSYIPKEYSAVEVHHSSLDLWRYLLSINLLANKLGMPELHEIVHGLNIKYNEDLLFKDFTENSYRTFIVISKRNTIEIKTPNDAIKAEDYIDIIGPINDFYIEVVNRASELPLIKNKIHALETNVYDLTQANQYMVNSKSWKVTAPLRKASSIKPKQENK